MKTLINTTLYTLFLLAAASVFAISMLAPATAHASPYYFPGYTVNVYYNPANQPESITQEEYVEMMEHSAWQLSQRTNRTFVYSGTTSAKTISGAIVAGWLTHEQLEAEGRHGTFTNGRSLTYVRGERVTRAEFGINTFMAIFSRSQMQSTMTHEFMHAIGLTGHSHDRFDLMYRSAPDQYYMPTRGDMDRMHPNYEADKCFVEVSKELDLMVPAVDGYSLFMKLVAPETWVIEDQAYHGMGSCSGSISGSNVTLPDVRSKTLPFYGSASLTIQPDGTITLD